MKKIVDKILNTNREVWTVILVFLVVFCLTTLLLVMTRKRNQTDETADSFIDLTSEQFIQATTVKNEDIVSHSSVSDCWIIYKDAVYDISDIITKQKGIGKDDCGTVIDRTLDTTTEERVRPYLVAYTFESKFPQNE